MHKISEQIAVRAIKLNPVELVTPVNAGDEKKKFIEACQAGDQYNPLFRYDSDKLRSAIMLSVELEDLQSEFIAKMPAKLLKYGTEEQNTAVKMIIFKRIIDALTTTRLARSIMYSYDADSVYTIKRKYAEPSFAMVTSAYNMATDLLNGVSQCDPVFSKSMLEELESEEFNAEEIKEVFLNVIRMYKFDWPVVIDSKATSIDVRDKNLDGKPKVVIPESRKVNGWKLMELVGHEIECHMRDTINSQEFWRSILIDDLQPLVPLLAKCDDETIYEGHAKNIDTIVSGSAGLPKPYATIAIDLALQGKTFYEVASELALIRAGADKEKAKNELLNNVWATTMRVFRGSTDPTNAAHYAFTKDLAYFAGFYSIKSDIYLDFASMSARDIAELSAAHFNMVPKHRNMWLCKEPYKIGVL